MNAYKILVKLPLSVQSVLADTLVIACGYLLYGFGPYFSDVISARVHDFLPVLALCLFLASLVSALFENIYNNQDYTSTSREAFAFVFNSYKKFNANESSTENNNVKRKHAFFIVLVKIFYVPLMLQFTVSNFLFLNNYISSGNHSLSGNFISVFNFTIYPFLIGTCFFIDTVFFLFGYLIYSDALGNTIKSVETTFSGWAVALLCYPPINNITANFIPALYHDHPQTDNDYLTFALRIAMISLLFIYTAASVNLGWKCSNLTNRGIVSHGVYAVIRHPAYIAKNLFWWLSLLPIMIDKPEAILYMAGWSFLYFLRAITEERHLKQDSDYIAYCQKVKYRFIPKLY